jgi:hypothetical protein
MGDDHTRLRQEGSMYGTFDELERAPLAYDPGDVGPRQRRPTIPSGAVTPPRLRAVDTTATQRLPCLTVADLRIPAELVRARAALYTRYARARGLQHSMRLWRAGYREALLSLARESVGAAEDAPCEAFFWEQHGDEYHVSVTFGQPAQSVVLH